MKSGPMMDVEITTMSARALRGKRTAKPRVDTFRALGLFEAIMIAGYVKPKSHWLLSLKVNGVEKLGYIPLATSEIKPLVVEYF